MQRPTSQLLRNYLKANLKLPWTRRSTRARVNVLIKSDERQYRPKVWNQILSGHDNHILLVSNNDHSNPRRWKNRWGNFKAFWLYIEFQLVPRRCGSKIEAFCTYLISADISIFLCIEHSTKVPWARLIFWTAQWMRSQFQAAYC